MIHPLLFIDSTHIKANANKKKFEKKKAQIETKTYQTQLDEEVNIDREKHGKKPSPPFSHRIKKIQKKLRTVRQTDPESGYYVKDGREKLFAYSFHTVGNFRGFLLGSLVTGGNLQ